MVRVHYRPQMRADIRDKYWQIFLKSFVGGIGWAAGITIGFALLATLLGFILNRLGGLPVVGRFFASLIDVTETALKSR